MRRNLLVVSLAANVVLVVLLVILARRESPSDAKRAFCSMIPTDVDFLISGLERNNDPLYSPIILRGFDREIAYCRPDLADYASSMMPFLRTEFGYLIATMGDATPERKREAHDKALKMLRELRAELSKAPAKR